MFDAAQPRGSWWGRFKANLHTRHAWRFVVTCLCAVLPPLAFATFVLVLSFDLLPRDSDHPYAVGVFFGLLVTLFFVPAYSFGYFLRSWRRANELTAAEALAKDPRAPILYLRPFKADKLSYSTVQSRRAAMLRGLFGLLGHYLAGAVRWTQRGEELLVEVIGTMGPVVAIGKPREAIPEMGAARVYVGDEWQEVVHDYMRRAQLILMVAGTTPGFSWEIGEVFRNEPFVPTLMMLPFWKRYRRKDVDRFTAMLTDASGLVLPTDLRKVRGVYFPARDQIALLPDDGSREEKTLNAVNPYMGALSQFMEGRQPGWRDTEVGVAEARMVKLRSFTLFVFVIWMGLNLLFLLIK